MYTDGSRWTTANFMHFLTVTITGPRGKLSPGDLDYITPGVISQDVRSSAKDFRGGKLQGPPGVS